MSGGSLASPATPWLALAAAVGAVVALLAWAARSGALRRRPLAVVTVLVAASVPLSLAVVWTRLAALPWLRVEHPLTSVTAAALVAFVAIRAERIAPRASRGRRLALDGLLGAASLGCAALAAGVSVGAPRDALTIIVAVDRSRSIDRVPGADARLRAELRAAETGMREDDRIAVVAFGATAALEDPPRGRADPSPPSRVEVARDATDIAAALRRALAEVPPDSAARVVLATDGVATRGDLLEAAGAAALAEVPVDVLPLDQKLVREVRVVAVRAPARADANEPIELSVVTGSPRATDAELWVRRDGEVIRRSRVQLAAGEDVVRVPEIAPGAGLHRYDVGVTGTEGGLDLAAEDDGASTFVRVRGGSTALVLDGDRMTGRVAHALAGAGFRTVEGDGSALPEDVAGLASYDLLVLGDVRAAELAPAQIEAIATWVRDLGGGLLFLGGDRSMGPGGFSRTPLEDVSPLSFDLSQRRRKASLSEVIAIDSSGSMSAHVASGATKLSLANEAAARSAALLGADDRLGVAHVDTATSWTVPLAPVTDQAAIGARIRAAAVGGGGIYVDVALKDAYAALARERTQLRHVLLFADGSDAEQMSGCRALVSGANARGITTSVVALGMGSDVAELESLSQLGRGRFYLVEDAARLPAVFAEETVVASRAAVQELEFVPSPGNPSPATRGVAIASAPPLRGYVVGIPKPRASVLLGAPDGDPLLATWSIGLGRAAVFASDLKDRWGAAWSSWPDASRLVAQLGRDLARRDDDVRVRVAAEASRGELRLRADVLDDDGRASSFRRLTAIVVGPDGGRLEAPLEPVTAGAYAATLPLARAGAYVASIHDADGGAVLATAGAVLSLGDELRDGGTDRALLGRVAALTGGKVRDTLAGVFRDRAPARFGFTPATAPFAIAAALALLAAVAARKLDVPDAVRARLDALSARAIAVARSAPPHRRAARIADAAPHAEAMAPAPPRERTAPPVAAPPIGAKPAGPKAPTSDDATVTPPPPRPARSAAEILLEKRRQGRP